MQDVLQFSKYAPQSPPDVGDDIAIFRKSAPYELKDYKGGTGEYMKDQNVSLTRSYSLPNLQLGIKYLNQIIKDGVEYDEDTLKSIETQNKSQLYIPRNLILPSLDESNIDPQKEFFIDSIYWLRYLRLEKSRLSPIIDNLTWVDLYLVGSNPYERYAARKLLSYYTDKELYLKFGKISKFLFPKTYSSKRKQLDGFVAFCLQPFGYFTVLNWSRPIKLEFHSYDIPLGPEKVKIFDLKDLYLNNTNIMPLLKLGIQIEACWPLITDKEAWLPFVNMINMNSEILHQEYKKLRKGFVEEKHKQQKITIELPDNLQSYEQKYNTCLICSQNQPLGDFSLCGHGTCMTCQSLLGSAKCPFCNEHFTADNLNDEFVRILQSNLGNTSRILLQDKVRQITALKSDRAFKFDWANGDVTLFC
jgi:hypothetical protein